MAAPAGIASAAICITLSSAAAGSAATLAAAAAACCSLGLGVGVGVAATSHGSAAATATRCSWAHALTLTTAGSDDDGSLATASCSSLSAASAEMDEAERSSCAESRLPPKQLTDGTRVCADAGGLACGASSRARGGTLVLLDTEGLAPMDQDEMYDAQVFALGLLLSSHFVLNQVGVIDESAIDQLFSFIRNETRETQIFRGLTPWLQSGSSGRICTWRCRGTLLLTLKLKS